MKKTILIIGAGGFIGGFIAREALSRGYDTYVGVRESTSRRYLQEPELKFVVFDYDNPGSVAETLRASVPESGRWDYIIWNLGATKCTNFSDFNKINFQYLRDFVEVLISQKRCARTLPFYEFAQRCRTRRRAELYPHKLAHHTKPQHPLRPVENKG